MAPTVSDFTRPQSRLRFYEGDSTRLNYTHAFRKSARPALGVLAVAMLALPGCQGRKVVARVNSETINEDDFTSRALRVDNIPAQSGLDAGGLTLVNMIKDSLQQQLAKSKGVVVTDDQVNKYITALERINPALVTDLHSGKVSMEDLVRQYRFEMSSFAIGTDNAKPDPKDVQAAFDEQKANLKVKANYTLRVLPLADLGKAQQSLDELKRSGDFKKAGLIGGLTASQVVNVGKDTVIPADQAPPVLKEALDALRPTEFVKQPVLLQGPNGQTVYVVAQLVDKQKERELTLDEIRPLLERFALAKKFPQWAQHAESESSNFILKSKENIQINIERYKPLRDKFVIPQPTAPMPAQAPPGGGTMSPAPSGGSAPNGTAPTPSGGASSAPSGGSVPPPSSGDPTPSGSSAPAPSGGAGAPPSSAPAPGGKM